MRTLRLRPVLLALAAVGLLAGSPPASAADEIDLRCRHRIGQRIVYKATLNVTDDIVPDGRVAQTMAFEYVVGPDRVDGRVTHAGGTLPYTFRLSRDFAFERIVPDDLRWARADGQYGFDDIYGPLFKQAVAFCGQRWTPGEARRIELPFRGVDADIVARLVRVGRRYGRRAALFEIQVTGRLTQVEPRASELTGSGTAWADLETGVTLESLMVSTALIHEHEAAPVVRIDVREERRLDHQMSTF